MTIKPGPHCFFLLAVVMLLLAVLVFGDPRKLHRNYHPYPITTITADNPANWKHPLTHSQISGYVTYAVMEDDGDLHIRVCDAPGIKGMDHTQCMVVECIPELPCVKPKVGDFVLVRGIVRYDAENPGHHWWEIHPCESLTVSKSESSGGYTPARK